MKLKCDFITNSSSTSYIIHVPKKDLQLISIQKIDLLSALGYSREQELKNLLKQENTTKTKVRKQLKTLIKALKKDGFLLLFEENTPWSIYGIVKDLFKEGTVLDLKRIEHGEDGQGFILIVARKLWFEK